MKIIGSSNGILLLRLLVMVCLLSHYAREDDMSLLATMVDSPLDRITNDEIEKFHHSVSKLERCLRDGLESLPEGLGLAWPQETSSSPVRSPHIFALSSGEESEEELMATGIRYKADCSVAGDGFVNIRGRIESSAGGALSQFAHGSGSYKNDQKQGYYYINISEDSWEYNETGDTEIGSAESIFNNSLGSEFITLNDGNLSASYNRTVFILPRNRPLGFESRLSERTDAESKQEAVSAQESYRYATRIDRDADIGIQDGYVAAKFVTEIHGDADIRFRSKTIDNRENYNGVFNLSEDLSSGKSSVFVSGTGMVDVDKLTESGGRQRTYEHGSGSLVLAEVIEPEEGRIAKNVTLISGPMGYGLNSKTSTDRGILWREGVSTQENDSDLISERFSDIERLKKNTAVNGLTEMQTEAQFVGRGEFRAQEDNHADIEDYSGDYSLQRKVVIKKRPRYSRPHVSVKKEVNIDPFDCRIADYIITVINDGNTCLGPVFVRDSFPSGTNFVESSVEPIELTSNYANWSIAELPSERSRMILLKLRIDSRVKRLINRVRVMAVYEDANKNVRRTSASGNSTIELNRSMCAAQDVSTSFYVVQNPDQPQVIVYKLGIKNLAEHKLTAGIACVLPSGMSFLNSSLEPLSVENNNITWSLDLSPGRTRIIEIKASVKGEGLFNAKVRLTARSVDGDKTFSEEMSAAFLMGDRDELVQSPEDDWLPTECPVQTPLVSGSDLCSCI